MIIKSLYILFSQLYLLLAINIFFFNNFGMYTEYVQHE